MFFEKHNRLKGFTLVELIVVIAIIAILAGVLIPSLSRFIDNGRYSNDVQKAASMSTVVNAHLISSTDEINNAHDVRMLLNEHEGFEVDFTPESKNTGFFYLANSKTVVALRYDEAEDYVDQELSLSDIVLMNHVELDSGSYDSPEELFGNGKHLLSSDGSPVAQAVDFIYKLAETGGQLDRYYDMGIETYEDLDTFWGKLLNIFSYNLSGTLVDKIEELLNDYDPKTTLYVSNLDWMTTATNDDVNAVTKIVFARGISHIPSFNATVNNNNVFNLPAKIVLPKTVRTVEKYAFAREGVDGLEALFGNTSISYAGSGELKVEDKALVDRSSLPSVAFVREKGPLPRSDEVTFKVIEAVGEPNESGYQPEKTEVDMETLNNFLKDLEVEVRSYKIELTYGADGSVVDAKVSIYTTEGYYGYIEPEEKT
jgi:prepilin-type N-terminal cleavage/methylation domain-containing protein